LSCEAEKILYFFAVLWIRNGFIEDLDPDPSINLNADPNPGSKTAITMEILKAL
jgi:hypothetical protein